MPTDTTDLPPDNPPIGVFDAPFDSALTILTVTFGPPPAVPPAPTSQAGFRWDE